MNHERAPLGKQHTEHFRQKANNRENEKKMQNDSKKFLMEKIC